MSPAARASPPASLRAEGECAATEPWPEIFVWEAAQAEGEIAATEPWPEIFVWEAAQAEAATGIGLGGGGFRRRETRDFDVLRPNSFFDLEFGRQKKNLRHGGAKDVGPSWGRRMLRRRSSLTLSRQLSTSHDAARRLLGVAADASPEDLKAAYRAKALAHHPDRHLGEERARAERHFKEVGEAYVRLSGATRRRAEDLSPAEAEVRT